MDLGDEGAWIRPAKILGTDLTGWFVTNDVLWPTFVRWMADRGCAQVTGRMTVVRCLHYDCYQKFTFGNTKCLCIAAKYTSHKIWLKLIYA